MSKLTPDQLGLPKAGEVLPDLREVSSEQTLEVLRKWVLSGLMPRIDQAAPRSAAEAIMQGLDPLLDYLDFLQERITYLEQHPGHTVSRP